MNWRKLFPLAVLGMLLVMLTFSLVLGAAEATESFFVSIPHSAVNDAASLDLHPEFAYDYNLYQWLVLSENDLRRLTASDVPFELAVDAGKIQITGYRFDPLAEGEPEIPAELRASEDGVGFRLVQLYGPTNDAWLAGLEATGLEVLQYYPHFTYLVWATASQARAAETWSNVRWQGAVHPAYKMNSDLKGRSGYVQNVDIFFYNNGDVNGTVDAIKSLGGNVLQYYPAQPDKAFYDAIVEIDSASFDAIARLDTVLWFGYASHKPELEDEMSSQIIAGNYLGGVPFNGYISHLANLGYDGSGVTWAIVDTGVDYDHPDLGSHIVGGYEFPGACNTGNPGEDCLNGGHGTFMAGIVGGDATAGFSDNDGFLYGLGVAPGYGIFAMNSL